MSNGRFRQRRSFTVEAGQTIIGAWIARRLRDLFAPMAVASISQSWPDAVLLGLRRIGYGLSDAGSHHCSAPRVTGFHAQLLSRALCARVALALPLFFCAGGSR